MGLLNVPGTGSASTGFSVPSPAADRSRAIPRMPRQSPRLGVTAMSITGSERPMTPAAGAPTGASSGSSMIPSCSSLRPTSRSESSMPLLSTPRMLVFLSSIPVPGMTAPAAANTPNMPARALAAPHTTCVVPLPVSTRQTVRRSALGWGSAASTRAATKPASPWERSITSSTSRPTMVSRPAISSTGASVSRWSLSQLNGTFTNSALRPCWECEGRGIHSA